MQLLGSGRQENLRQLPIMLHLILEFGNTLNKPLSLLNLRFIIAGGDTAMQVVNGARLASRSNISSWSPKTLPSH